MKRAIATLWLIIITFGIQGTAYAQSRCAEILSQGIFNYNSVSQNDYLNQIMWARFVRTNYESSRSDSSLGFGVPVGDIVLGGNYTGSEHASALSTSERQYFNQITASREVDVALMSADPAIVSAWRDCMLDKGGLTIRFETLSASSILMHIEFFNVGPIVKDGLKETINLGDDVTVVQNRACIKKNYVHRVGVPCAVQLEIKNPLKVLTVALQGKQTGAATAFLAARIELLNQEKYFPFSEDDKMYRRGGNGTNSKRHETVKELPQSMINEGWKFVPKSVHTGLVIIRKKTNKDNNCHSEFANVTAHRLIYGYTMYAPDRTRRDGVIWCTLNPSIKLARSIWIAAGESENHSLLSSSALDPSANEIGSEKLEDVAKNLPDWDNVNSVFGVNP